MRVWEEASQTRQRRGVRWSSTARLAREIIHLSAGKHRFLPERQRTGALHDAGALAKRSKPRGASGVQSRCIGTAFVRTIRSRTDNPPRPHKSGAEARALQTLARWPYALKPREASWSAVVLHRSTGTRNYSILLQRFLKLRRKSKPDVPLGFTSPLASTDSCQSAPDASGAHSTTLARLPHARNLAERLECSPDASGPLSSARYAHELIIIFARTKAVLKHTHSKRWRVCLAP